MVFLVLCFFTPASWDFHAWYCCGAVKGGTDREGIGKFVMGVREVCRVLITCISNRSGGPCSVFADRRPVSIQAVPYILAFSVFEVLFAMFAPRHPAAHVLPRRVLVLVFLLIAVWCYHFVSAHGMLCVCFFLDGNRFLVLCFYFRRWEGFYAWCRCEAV